MNEACSSERLLESTRRLIAKREDIAELTGLSPDGFLDFPDLAGALLAAVAGLPADLVVSVYRAAPDLEAISLVDIFETARRNFETGGAVAALLFARGVHATMGHRVTHRLWLEGDHIGALAVKARCAGAFATDIHPGAQIGAGFWLDHGLGFVAGETAVIGQNVSIWHNVTLGSTLSDSGNARHPVVENGAVIGAGALILGHIRIGAGANIAAGAIVTRDVPPGTLVTGPKAQNRGPARISFASPSGDKL